MWQAFGKHRFCGCLGSTQPSTKLVRDARHWNPKRSNTTHKLHILYTMNRYVCRAFDAVPISTLIPFSLWRLCGLQIFVFPNVFHSTPESVGKPLSPVSVDSKCLLVRFAQQRIMARTWREEGTGTGLPRTDLNKSASAKSIHAKKYLKSFFKETFSELFCVFKCLQQNMSNCKCLPQETSLIYWRRINSCNVFDCSLLQAKCVKIRMTQSWNAEGTAEWNWNCACSFEF